ncbi:MAG: ROK family protein [Phycisphaerales bacterium]|nr:ROK family protein [Phycisphaerales bacterium]
MSELIWAIDIGGTTTRVGVVAQSGVIAASRSFATPAKGSIAAYSSQLANAARELIAKLQDDTQRAANESPSTLSHGCGREFLATAPCGVAIPGIVDAATTRVVRAVNLPVLEGVEVREFVSAALGMRNVVVRNDVVCAGLAQWRAAPPIYPGAQRFAYLSLGTGVAACVILDGDVVSHTRGGPGHIGHLVVDTSPDAPRCRCGGRGCLEALVGGWAIVSAERASDGSGDIAHATMNTARDSGRGDLSDAAQRAKGLAVGLTHLASLYAPDVIFLGGGVTENHPHLIDAARREFEQRRTDVMPSGLAVDRAPIKSNMAGLLGAAQFAEEFRASRATPPKKPPPPVPS